MSVEVRGFVLVATADALSGLGGLREPQAPRPLEWYPLAEFGQLLEGLGEPKRWGDAGARCARLSASPHPGHAGNAERHQRVRDAIRPWRQLFRGQARLDLVAVDGQNVVFELRGPLAGSRIHRDFVGGWLWASLERAGVTPRYEGVVVRAADDRAEFTVVLRS